MSFELFDGEEVRRQRSKYRLHVALYGLGLMLLFAGIVKLSL